jgi:hypothetical protein
LCRMIYGISQSNKTNSREMNRGIAFYRFVE